MALNHQMCDSWTTCSSRRRPSWHPRVKENLERSHSTHVSIQYKYTTVLKFEDGVYENVESRGAITFIM